jgi:hypothetical protein
MVMWINAYCGLRVIGKRRRVIPSLWPRRADRSSTRVPALTHFYHARTMRLFEMDSCRYRKPRSG